MGLVEGFSNSLVVGCCVDGQPSIDALTSVISDKNSYTGTYAHIIILPTRFEWMAEDFKGMRVNICVRIFVADSVPKANEMHLMISINLLSCALIIFI